MIGEIIQEYLVSLGVQIDKPGFRQMDDTIRAAEQTVTRATGSWAANFVKASGIIGSAIAGVTASVGGLMRAAARNDLEMEKYARSMLMSREAAEKMKRATDALGESINDISLSPELYGRFQQLTADGSRMQIGGDFKETMKDLRDVMFEFTRLKQEASYAMTWIGYYLAKYLQKPLADIREKFRSFNDSFVKNMSVWTEKAAKAIVYIINIGKHFLDFLFDVGKEVGNIWDSFPKGVKIATAAVLGFWAVLKMTPLGRMMTLVSGLLLLLDDYYGYMEGKQAAFGEYWDKLNEYLEIAKQKWEEIRGPLFDAIDGIVTFLSEIKDLRELAWFVETTVRLGKAFLELGSGVVSFVADAIKAFLEGFDNRGGAEQTASLVEKLGRLLSTLYQWTVDATTAIGSWMDTIGKDKDVRDFAAAIGETISLFIEFVNVVWELVETALPAFFEASDEGREDSISFADALREVLKFVTALIRYFNRGSDALKKFLAWMKDSAIYKTFWKGMGSAAQMFLDVVTRAFKTVGKLGQALLALTNKDYKLAASLAGDAWDALLGKDKTRLGNGGGGGGLWQGTKTLNGYNLDTHDVRTDSGVTAETLNKLFEGGVLEGMGNAFIEVGRKFGIDPAFLAAITKAENSYGKDMSGKLGNEEGYANNVFSNESGKTFSSVLDNLIDMAEELTDMTKDGLYFAKGAFTIDDIGMIYAPPGAGNDIRNENQYWPSMVKSAYEDMLEIQGRLFTGGRPVEKTETVSAPLAPEEKASVFSEPTTWAGRGGSFDNRSIFENPNLDVMENVSTEGAQDVAIAMINYAGELYKKLFPNAGELWVSAVTNGGHAEGSGHYRGMKGDVGGDAFEIGGTLGLTEEEAMRNRDLFTRLLLSVGIGANDEYTYPSAGSTGGHFDLDAEGTVWNDSQYNGEYGGFRMPQQTETGGTLMQLSASVNNLSRSIRNAFAPVSSYGMDGAPTGTPDLTQEVQSGILTPIVQEQPKQQESVFRPVRDAYSAIFGEIKGVLVNIYQAVVDKAPEPDRDITIETPGVDLSPMADIFSGGFDRLQDAIKSIDLGSMIGGAIPAYAGAGASGPVSIVNTINLGGITVNGGANASAKEIGTATANEVMSRLDRDANYLYTSRSFAPNTIHVSK